MIYNLLNYAVFYIMWFMISKFNHKIFKYQNELWINNNSNFLNALLIVSAIMYEKYNCITPTTNSMFYFSAVAFYVFDMKRLEVYSLFWMHHILTVFMILTMQAQVDINYMEIARTILFIFELGNLPIYLVYGMKTSIYKSYWNVSLALKISIIFEFIWFIIFRCILPLKFIPKIHNLYKFYLSIFILVSIKWAIGMFHSMRKQFSKKPIELTKQDRINFSRGSFNRKNNKRKLHMRDVIDDDYKYIGFQ